MPEEAPPAHTIEREVKLSTGPGFSLPALHDLNGGARAVPSGAQELDAVYYDTPDLRLARWGVTVRHRSGDDVPWTVKLPENGGGELLARRELSFDAAPGTVPNAVASLVLAYRRTAPLEPVARLVTRRWRLELRDAGSGRLGEIDDDDVAVLRGSEVVDRFHEVEVELFDDAPAELLADVVERLRAAGAGAPGRIPKLIRALGERATEQPDLAKVPLGDEPTAAHVVRSGLTEAVRRLVQHDPVVRLDAHDEGVHQVRVAARRIRAVLRTARPVLVTEWFEPLRDELRWFAGLLSPVRDADVLAVRLRRQGEGLALDDREAIDDLLARLRGERDAARSEAIEAMTSARYAELLDRLVDAARAPATLPEADGPAAEVLSPLVKKTWRRLARGVGALGDDPDDEQLHRVRILAKRARYAADMAAPVLGKGARRLASRLGELQDVLGEHQDGAVAEAWLRGRVDGMTPAQAVVAGQLIAAQRAEGERARREWPAAWKAARKAAP